MIGGDIMDIEIMNLDVEFLELLKRMIKLNDNRNPNDLDKNIDILFKEFDEVFNFILKIIDTPAIKYTQKDLQAVRGLNESIA